MSRMITLANDALRVDIAPLGAELQSVTDATGQDWLWNGDPAIWAGRSPLLFPVIGRHPDGKVLIDGKRYPIKSHGVARTSLFALTARDDTSCTLRLTDSDETRQAYPFGFALDMTYRLDGAALTLTARIANTGTVPMPFCFGYTRPSSGPCRARAACRIASASAMARAPGICGWVRTASAHPTATLRSSPMAC